MEKDDLQAVIEECSKMASSWYGIASNLTDNTRSLLFKAKEDTDQNISTLEQSPVKSPNTIDLLKSQSKKIQEIIKIENDIEHDLEYHKKNLSKFSITLFGRTMAGKSTLMEILTQGNGQSIGLGAQRTTRDVRHYVWNRLDITDVPGIAAVDGEGDAEIAFSEAKKADMILFLLTDDGPQESEAEWFSKLINLGKSILCVINVKASIPEGKSEKFIEKQIQKRFDMERLETIRRQFLEFAHTYNQSWEYIPFVYVHLKSAFEAQHKQDPISKKYTQLSHIDQLKDHIVEIVKTKGKFYRVKNFADIISKPMLDSLDILFAFARKCCKSCIKLDKTIQEIENWRDQAYLPQAKSSIEDVCRKVKNELDMALSSFVDDNYQNANADKEWRRTCKQAWEHHKNDIEDLGIIAYDKMKQFTEGIMNPMVLSLGLHTGQLDDLKGKEISGTKEKFRFAFSTLATLAGPVAFLGFPAVSVALTIGAGITGLTTLFLKSKKRKEQERKKLIEEKLNQAIEKSCKDLFLNLNSFLSDQIIKNTIDLTLYHLSKIRTEQFKLYHDLLQLAAKLNTMLCELNKRVVVNAFRHNGLNDFEAQVSNVARIPGNVVLIFLNEHSASLDEKLKPLQTLMSEEIQLAINEENKTELIAGILKIEENRIMLKEASARIKPSSQEIELARIRLAQQAAGLPIWILLNKQ